jgi:putative ABC transport system permease protein
MLQDFRFALRLLNRNRGYAAMAILTVALGVGANTAVFSVADSVLFRPLPFAAADRLFMLRMSNLKTGQTYARMPDANADAALATGLFEASAGPSGFSERVLVREGTTLGTLDLALVPPQYLEMLGVRPILGRPFGASDAGTRAALLSYRTWMRRYGGDPGIVDSFIQTPSTRGPLHIVGILAPGFRNPLIAGTDGMTMQAGRFGGAPLLVRLQSGLGAAAAQARLNALPNLETDGGRTGLRLVPLREEMAGRQDQVLWLLVAAAAIVMIVACVNLGNLISARGSARAREFAVRSALGGSRGRLARLLLIESACIAALGTVAGLGFAYLGFTVLAAQLPPVLARVVDPALNFRALGFGIAMAIVSCAAFGVLPAWRLSRADARDGLRLGRLQMSAPRRGRQLLVALEVAICLALLVGASLIGRSLLQVLSRDLGFESNRVVARFDLPTMFIKDGNSTRPDMPARMAFVQERLRDVRAVPGVRAAGATSALPFGGAAPNAPLFEGRERGGVYNASAGFFGAMGIRLLAGRDFTDQESFTNAPVGILNESAARQICGSVDCVGRVVQAPKQPARTIMGVVANVRQSLLTDPMPAMYVPFDAVRFYFSAMVIDSDDTPENREGLKRLLSSSPDVRVNVTSLNAARDAEVSPYRFNAIIVGAFAVLTLALAVVGVYGVMTAVVGERTREFGIRLALGATRERVNGHVLRQASLPIGAGLAAGLVLAVWGSRYLASLLYGVVPLDVVSFAAAAAVILVSGVVAALIPARRAGRVDPIIALRAE